MENLIRKELGDGRTLKIERSQRSSGQVLRISVITRLGRIVGVAEMLIPLMEGYSLEDKIGHMQAKQIEDDLVSIALRIADAVQPIGDTSRA